MAVRLHKNPTTIKKRYIATLQPDRINNRYRWDNTKAGQIQTRDIADRQIPEEI
jgi:hypothetical protein